MGPTWLRFTKLTAPHEIPLRPFPWAVTYLSFVMPDALFTPGTPGHKATQLHSLTSSLRAHCRGAHDQYCWAALIVPK